MASTTHWEPNRSAALEISPGSATAAELTEILSAPARSSRWKSSSVRIRPHGEGHKDLTSPSATTTSATVSRSSHGSRDVQEDDLVRP
jgi:hypothetical protein